MTDMMVKIMVEILDILANATIEMKQGRTSVFTLPLMSLEAHVSCRSRKVSQEGGGDKEA